MKQALLLLLFSSTAFAAASPEPVERAAPAEEVLFFEDFSGPQLDRTRWNVIVTGNTVNNEQQAYVDTGETITFLPGNAEGATNGALAIVAASKPGYTSAQGRKYDFLSGRIDTRGKAEFTYGTLSARIKMTAGPGLWPAFWALGTGRWPDTGEIDIMENGGEPLWSTMALHGRGYSGNTPIVHKSDFPADKPNTDWHVYSVDWTKDAIVFRIDGAEQYRVTKADIEKYGAWAFDNPKHLIVNLALGGVYPQGYNKATTPYPGLPQPTVDLIKSGKARLLVDWIKVTKSP